MSSRESGGRTAAYALVMILGLSAFAARPNLETCAAQKKEKEKKAKPEGEPVLWQEPADIGSRDLLLGIGGKAMQPDLSRITFLEEQKGGYSTKYRVRDGAGREWVAKIGKEAQSEIAASRLLWAVGYFVEATYLAPRVEIEGKGFFENARFEARPEDVERLGEWKWSDNPFSGRQEFQGLKVMMVLLGNWDIKDSNNLILAERDQRTGAKRLLYLISDLGSTFGKTSRIFTGTRNEPEDYVKAGFVEKVEGERVDFIYGGKRGGLFIDITVEQAQWIGGWLSRLSEQQIRDAFRAANYSQSEVETLSGEVRARVNELVSLNQTLGRKETR